MRIAIVLLLFITVTASNLFAQNGTVSGQVFDSKTKEALPGVNAEVRNEKGTTTDLDGNFKLELEPGRYFLTFSFIGYQNATREVRVAEGQITELKVGLFEKLEELDIVVVTGSKYERRISEEVTSIEVMRPEVMKNSNNVIVAEGLSRISGLSLIDNQASIRGGSSYSYGAGTRVLMMVDGLSMQTPDRSDIRWNYVPMEIMEQIEVIKGASSALYGASALNGVINFRTAWPKSEPETEATVFWQGYAPPARRELKWWGAPTEENIALDNDPKLLMPQRYGGNFSYKKKVDRFDFVVGAFFLKDRGFVRMNDQQFVRMTGKFRHRPEKCDRLTYGISINLQESRESDFFFWKDQDNGGYVPFGSNDYDHRGTLTIYGKQNMTFDPWVSYYDKKEGKHSLQTRYYRNATQFTVNFPTGNLVMAEYQYQRKFQRGYNFTAGANAQYLTIQDRSFGHNTGSITALFAQLDKKFGRFNPVLGGRWEMFRLNEEVGYSNPIGHFGLNYQAGKRTFLRYNIGQGYRFPSIAERFVSERVDIISVFPNPDLKPEYGFTSELGVKQTVKISEWLGYVDLAFFWMEYWDLVEFQFGLYAPTPIPPGSSILDYIGFRSQNVSRARIAGFEFSYTGEGKLGSIPMRLQGGYTYTYPAEIGAEGDTTLRNAWNYLGNMFRSTVYMDDNLLQGLLPYRYRHQLKADIEIDLKRFTFGTQFQYYSFMEKIEEVFAVFIPGVNEFRDKALERKVSGDIFWNLRASYDMNNYGTLSFIVNNVLNRESAVRIARMDPPLNFTVQYRIKI